MAAGDRRPRFRRRALVLATVALVLTVACWPSSRLVGVDSVITRHTLPLWIKTVDFIDRDLNLARTAADVLGRVDGDEPRAMAALAWTRANVRPQPKELPVVDDHVWHIVVRGYGMPDQQADVFTTLLAYEGVPAFWGLLGERLNEVPISYVRLDGRWVVFDVARGIAFRRADGRLASAEDLQNDAGIVRAAAASIGAEADRYLTVFRDYRAPAVPDVSRADMQRPGPRVMHEARKLVGMQGNVWQMRPHGTPGQGQGQ